MRKYFGAIVALALIASLLGGCRGGNVSDREDGVITDPTNTSTTATMPSTDTAPIATTEPVVTTGPSESTDATMNSGTTDSTEGNTSTNSTGESGATEATGSTNGRSRQAQPGTSRGMN